MKLTFLNILIICSSLMLRAQVSKQLNLNAGNLSVSLTTEEKNTVTSLTLTGNMDARDFKTMRDDMPVLAEIDLSGVRIVAYYGVGGTNLSSTNYPENAIPEQAFFNSNSYNGKNSLKKIILPSSITSIGNAAFGYCSNLMSIIVPDSVTNIGETAFGACQSLESVEIPNSVTFIGSSAFWGCTKMASFSFPLSVTSIEYNLFNNSGLTTVNIPPSINSVKPYAFSDCSKLNTVSIPSSVTFIGDKAFNNCTSLTSIYCYLVTPINLSLSNGVFSNVNKANCILYVPPGSKTAYQSASQWKDFENIVEMDFTQIFDDLNLIRNGKFDIVDSTGNPISWFYNIENEIYGIKPEIKNGVAVLAENGAASSENWHYEFSQENIKVLKDSLYLVSFVAWADNDRIINFSFKDSSVNVYKLYGYSPDIESDGRSEWNLPITTTPARYTFHVYFDQIQPNTVQKLSFMLSGDTGTVYLDSVSLISRNDLKIIETLPSFGLRQIALITSSSAMFIGNIYSNGGIPVLEKGFCWSTSPFPTTSDSTITIETWTDYYSIMIKGLVPNTTYYVRAYAKNENGISYGNNTKFKSDDCSGVSLQVYYDQFLGYFSRVSNPSEPNDTCTFQCTHKFCENGEAWFIKPGNWGIRWGSNKFPSGSADLFGPGISVPKGTYEITFNNYTAEFSFEEINVACNIQDSLALVAFYNSASGNSWARNDNWLTGKVQTWYGVTVNKEGRVVELNLARNGLQGYIPMEIGNLNELKILNLGNNLAINYSYYTNNLGNQPLPQTLENLVKLELVALDALNMNSDLPDIFPGMTSLRELYLQFSNFTNQSFPAGITNCSKLSSLEISGNNFHDLPDLSSLTNLTTLFAQYCNLSFDDIEPNLRIPNFTYYDQLLVLGAADLIDPPVGETFTYTINIGGEHNVYQWFRDGQELKDQNTNTLKIENASFDDAGEYFLFVTNSFANQLTFSSQKLTLFQKHLPFYKALEALYNTTGGNNWYDNSNWLSDQPITNWFGIVENGIGQYNLNLNDNNLIGSLPGEIGDLTAFQTIQISNNPGLTGEIPSTIGKLSNLYSLFLNDNNLSGNIPKEIGQMSNLQSLNLINNNLSGSFPSKISNCVNLYHIYLVNNMISALPDFSGMQNLVSIYVSDNKLEFDDIEPNIGKNFFFDYTPQKTYGEKEIKYLNIGDTLTFNGKAGGTNNAYSWNKNNVTLPSQKESRLVLDSMKATDDGIYTCIATSSSVPYLVLVSEPKVLIDSSKVDDYESDNYFREAKEISNSEKQYKSIYPAGDRDISRFEILQPSQVKINFNSGQWETRLIKVFESDTVTVLTYAYDSVTFTAFNPGFFYIETISPGNEIISEYSLKIDIIPFVVDKYEPDNFFVDAKQIYPFVPQYDHNLKPAGDWDFVKFEISDAPRNITIDVYDETEMKDFYVWLYGEDSNFKGFSNYGSKNNGSRLQTTITENGFYYVKVEVSTWHSQDMYDEYTISLTTDGQPPVIACNVNDSLALVAIYNATNGKYWGKNGNWLTGNVQSWYGVTLNTEGRVTELNLTNNKLYGYIPSEIGNLTELKSLNLGNHLTVLNGYGTNYLNYKPLPDSIANLTKLEFLSLEKLYINNELPDIFGGMVNLRELYIQGNFFTNQNLPDGVADCKKLEILDISSNNFDSLPDLSQQIRLTDFNADSCYFSFEDIEPNLWIPHFSYNNQRIIIGNTEFLNPEAGETIARNIFVGGANNVYQWMKDGQVLPGQTTNTLTIDSVTTVDAGIYTLRITNTIVTQLVFYSQPLILFQNQSLLYKALESLYNNTGGDNWYNNSNWLTNEPLTSWFGIQYANGLFYLTLSNNNLTGSLPENMGNLLIFNIVQLIYNPGLTGEIPSSIGQLTNLQHLYLNNNNITGTIPSSIGQMTNLISFNISKNHVENIPDEIINCSNLKYLYLYDNLISELPDLTELHNLEKLIVSNNKLEFDDIIPLVDTFPMFEYSPQDSIGQSKVIKNTPGERIVYSLATNGQGNKYQWYKNGEKLISKTTQVLELNNLEISDSGEYYCNVTNPLAPDLTLTSRIITLKVEYDYMCPQHFQKVWVGSGYDQMNIYVIEALKDSLDLEPGDEIGVFDGDLCVGFGKLKNTVNQQNIFQLIVSKNDGTENGFNEGNEISYRFWDCSAEQEYTMVMAKYYDTSSNPLSDQLFRGSASAFVKLSAISQICQTLAFNSGWNLFSLPGQPNPAKTETIFQSLVNNNSLVKIQDGLGNSMENRGIFGGWQDNIGDISPSDGFKIKVSSTDSTEICVALVDYPYPINLRSGWNLIGYPQTKAFSGLEIVKQLIDRGKLVKIQDEFGNSIENWGIFGGWKNNIGNFTPGKGFKIKVNASDTLWIYERYPKSSVILNEKFATTHFLREFKGNGFDHMNINLVDLPLNSMQAGDEIAVFDGGTCVGAVTLMPHHLHSQTASIVASATDNQGIPGFVEGNPFVLKLWNAKNYQEFKLEPEIVKGTSTFVRNETTVASLEKYATTGLEGLFASEQPEINCYPNPFSDEITIEINLSSDAQVQVEVLNQLGQRVKYINTGEQLNRGIHRLIWDGTNSGKGQVATGIYVIRMKLNEMVYYRKVVYSK